MADQILSITDGFWNVRGSFKVAPLIDVGTQMSLVRLAQGGFVLLDSYRLEGEVKQQILELTDGGHAVTAILNLHPFHTVHVQTIAETFPDARLFGTRRHAAQAPRLRWESVHTEDPELNELFSEDFIFTVPRGVDFIPQKEHLHFASVLAFHRQSRTLHVDDTLTWMPFPLVGGLHFHPTLASVLERRPGAVNEFRSWVEEDLLELASNAEHLCTAHMRPLPPSSPENHSIAARIQEAYRRTNKKLASHQHLFG